MENASEVVPQQVTASPPQVTVSVDWTAAASVRPEHVNQIMAQLGNPTPDGIPDGVLLGLGSVMPPIITGPDALKRLAEIQGSAVSVDVAGRFHMSRGFIDAAIEVLQATAAQYDAVVSQVQASKSSEQG